MLCHVSFRFKYSLKRSKVKVTVTIRQNSRNSQVERVKGQDYCPTQFIMKVHVHLYIWLRKRETFLLALWKFKSILCIGPGYRKVLFTWDWGGVCKAIMSFINLDISLNVLCWHKKTLLSEIFISFDYNFFIFVTGVKKRVIKSFFRYVKKIPYVSRKIAEEKTKIRAELEGSINNGVDKYIISLPSKGLTKVS